MVSVIKHQLVRVERSISVFLRRFTALTASDKRTESAQLSICVLMLKYSFSVAPLKFHLN